jgi:hypothetical protein
MGKQKRKFCATAVALVLAVGVTACGDDDDGGVDDADKAALVDGLAEALGIDREIAECVADSMIDSIGEEELLALNESDSEPTAEQTEAVIDAFSECDVPLGG